MNNMIAAVLRASVHHFVGRLGADPEIKYLESGKVVARGRMAVNQLGGRVNGQDPPPDWFTVEVWGDKAQAFADSCRKGCLIQTMGRVKSNRWTDRQGVERVDLIVQADAVQLLAPPQGQQLQASAPAQQPAPAPQGQQAMEPPPAAAISVPAAADDIPF